MVLPAFRRKGGGRRLLESVEGKARELGCCKLTLEVMGKNDRACVRTRLPVLAGTRGKKMQARRFFCPNPYINPMCLDELRRFISQLSDATLLTLAGILLLALPAWAKPVSGSLPAQWNIGAEDCKRRHNLHCRSTLTMTANFILRQSPCASFEANFPYLLIGSDKALLIDTGAIADPQAMPLAKTIMELLPEKDHKKLPLLVTHTHRHLDHRAGDPQFASLPSVQTVPIDLEGARVLRFQ